MIHTALANNISNKLKLNIGGTGNNVTLQENAPGPGLKEVTIRGLPNLSSAYTLDKSNIRNLYLKKSQPNINCGCDGLISVTTDDPNPKTVTIFCDLKSTKLRPNDYEPQLISSYLKIEHIKQLATIFENIDCTTQSTFTIFYLKSGSGRITKTSVRPGAGYEISTTSFTHTNFNTRRIILVAFERTHGNKIHISKLLSP
ncbi:hypothetical protein F0P96_10945 [Hymenobacter busanensis]|uniref:Uncharacterized protein n=1 Tax=Hymenobacter busanensis TaxID=2607656 RepID=A0A7L5A258_9BACT|nr:hypothetical protein [Hymenobacter busanensis]KAA9333477.1 hypothetical protein F0P96_10945 [Hymenobacter busanensis]QHJ07840.1 hypothetical protein GUY19_11340 [Hymenobacter busanensis]